MAGGVGDGRGISYLGPPAVGGSSYRPRSRRYHDAPLTRRQPRAANRLALSRILARTPAIRRNEAMPGRLTDLIEIPDAFWARPDTVDALRCRDIGRLFRLLSQYVGASQTRLAIAMDTTQPKVSGIMRGIARVETLDVFERIADGLNMPGQARMALGLAPRADQPDAQHAAGRQSERPGRDIPPGDARGLTCFHGFRDLHRTIRGPRRGRGPRATANLCRPHRGFADRRDPGRHSRRGHR